MEDLVIKYLRGDADERERSVVESWIAESSENLRQLNAIKSIVDASKTPFQYSSIDCRRAYRQMKEKSNMYRMPFLYYFQKVAAVLFLPLVAVSAIIAVKSAIGMREAESAMQKLSVPYGAVSEFSLSDGSKVWLGSGSTIECPIAFGKGTRAVKLEGEALFSVSSDKEHPFVVNAGEMAVTAVGTEFMVNNYERDSLAVVALRKGSVSVNFSSRPGTCVNMKPDDVLTLHKTSSDYDVVSSDLDKWYCWTNGRIVFSKDRFDAVLTRLEHIYNVEFRLEDPAVRSYLYRASFTNETLDEIISILQMSLPVSFRKIGDGDGGSTRATYEVVAQK